MFIINYISNLLHLPKELGDDFYTVTKYLDRIIDESVVKKDIKAFLLFIYLHDNTEILHSDDNKDGYNRWRILCTYNYAYQTGMFDTEDIQHYLLDIRDNLDDRIVSFLFDNMNTGYNKYFLKYGTSWLIFNKNIIKLKIKAVVKMILIYRKVLHERYKPGGVGYLEVKKHFETF